jgi:hypothetical protein
MNQYNSQMSLMIPKQQAPPKEERREEGRR